VVLGSGFQAVLESLGIEAQVAYRHLPGFPQPLVGGHSGRVCIARLGGERFLCLAGRAHFYEGHSPAAVTFPIRVLARLGVRRLLLTNAAGAIAPGYRPGDFMILRDHINLVGVNPLRGPIQPGDSRFVDLTEAYDPGLRTALRAAARAAGVRAHTGVYLAVSGPTYETPAEIRAFARLGAHAVGMSTVFETIVARQCGLRVAGLSCITNLAARRGRSPLTHAEVLARGQLAGSAAVRLLAEFARHCGREDGAARAGNEGH
jgi:inosine/guanosine/xanthosine phosphorylase family protein